VQRFGFRTVELRLHDGIYVNGKKAMLKGVCRHSEWPESGRTLSKAISIMDVNLMKDMNMNAVRMSHYPPDQHFLDVCDSLGLFVLDELTGWQNKYDTAVGKKLVKEMVVRDVNHPAIIIWDNGNEGGWNTALDDQFKLYDPQNRVILHPWAKFNGTDTRHYPDYNYVVNSALYGNDVFLVKLRCVVLDGYRPAWQRIIYLDLAHYTAGSAEKAGNQFFSLQYYRG
jgi:hypothetical protein